MKKILLLIQLVYAATCLFAQAPIPYGPVPTKAQLNWHEIEMYCIIHYGVDTYTDKEWGFGDESPKLINPSNFNAMQIVNAAKTGGFKGVVVVAKHHDGLCLWPTKTTLHNISQSPWKNGKGDMVRDYQMACSKSNVQLGLYCSPWDRNNLLYGKPGYLDIYQKQLKELNGNYGPVFISWHDGANGGTGYYGGEKGERKIDRSTYYNWSETWGIVRALQPGAAIFGDVGPDVRWVGNEEGVAGETCWATYTPEAPTPGAIASNGFSQYWKAVEGTQNGKFWMPAECDVSLRPGWFYHASENNRVKTASELVRLYYNSVGRGANLNLGLSPNPQGQLDLRDVQELEQFGVYIKKTFKNNLLKKAILNPSNIRNGQTALYGSRFLTDSSRYTYWATDDKITTPFITAEFAEQQQFDVIQLRENIKLGQRIRSFSIDILKGNDWMEIAKGTSIGANRLIRLNSKIWASKIRLRITESDACVAVSHFGIYNQPLQPKTPTIRRDKQGFATILADKGQAIYYTLNGDTPNKNSKRYLNKFEFKSGGSIRAVAVDQKGRQSDIVNHDFGHSKLGWAASVSVKKAQTDPGLMIDEQSKSIWNLSFSEADSILPLEITVDMRTAATVRAFTFLPNSTGNAFVDGYQIEGSMDGKKWEKLAAGEFGNIRSNPVEQIVSMRKPREIRFFKFIITHLTGTTSFGICELGIK